MHTTLDKNVPVDHRRYGNAKCLDTDWVQKVLIRMKNDVENFEKNEARSSCWGTTVARGRILWTRKGF